jgi:rfaE bifunctional protein nucleotidyltransferase chain/domain
MSSNPEPGGKVVSANALVRRLRPLQREGKCIVFTNGCFDLIHPGHVRYLRAAKQLGDVLVVGVNSDRSVRRLKGRHRPVVAEAARAEVLAALAMVDFVTVFDDDTPYALIARVQPDVLVKGGDWRVAEIVGSDIVRRRGGEVRSLPFAPGFSTTAMLERFSGRRRSVRSARRGHEHTRRVPSNGA